MSETSTPESNTPASSETPKGRCTRDGHARGGLHGRRRWRFWALLALIGAGAAFLPRAWAGGGWGGHCSRGEITEQGVREHLYRAGDHVLDEVGATDAQRAALTKLADEAAPEIVAFKKEARALAMEASDALFDADRANLEVLRQDGLELADRASARGLDFAVRAIETLTPEQRESLRAKVAEHHK